MKKNIDQKLKNESFVRRLEDSGVKVESLKESIKQKSNGKPVSK